MPDPSPSPAAAAEEATKHAAREQARAKKTREEAEAAAGAAILADREARAKMLAKESADLLAAATKSLRKASPESPIALRCLECCERIGGSMYGTDTNRIDLRNSQFAGVSLLWDGFVCHVVNGKDPSKSFWVGAGNIAAMYPRLDA